MKMESWVINVVNKVLLKLRLPCIDLLKLRQQYTFYRIRRSVPCSIKWLKSLTSWAEDKKIDKTSPIYVMWWTGEETMPPVVRLCYKNLCRNAKRHPIVLITKNNIYTLFPSIAQHIKEVEEKYNERKICIQHFSDITRSLILDKIGGIWIDATVFVTPDWDENLVGKSFYSGRRSSTFANSGKSITAGQWTSYFIASVKGNPLINFMYNGLLEYYSRKGWISEYYTMDYLFTIGMSKSPIVRQIIESVPEINANLFGLESLMHKPYNQAEYNSFLATAPFFKLNHRIEYHCYDDNGERTVFGYMTSLFG